MIFVTGGTGFLGSYVLKELVEKGYSVRALWRRQERPSHIPAQILDRVEWVHGDILDVDGLSEWMRGADAVIHSAALVSFYKKDRRSMFKINIEGTANLVNTALDLGISKFIHVSSVAALGRSGETQMIGEDHPWAGNKHQTNYSISKYYAEMEVWRGMAEGLEPLIVNPSTIMGYGDWNQSSLRIFKSVYDGFPWYTSGTNGFVDVRDVARAMVLLMEAGVCNERFIISADNWSFHQLFNRIADGFSVRHPNREATVFLAALAWRVEKLKSLFSGKPPLLTRESAAIARKKTGYRNSKILGQLPGFQFMPLEQSIEEACKAYLAHPP
jgi:dihydroflavonol-4-reductase